MKRTFSWTRIILCAASVAITATLGPGRLWGQLVDSQAVSTAGTSSFEFALELDGEPVALFNKCSGLVSASDVYEGTVLTTAGLQMDQKRPGSRLLGENIKLTYNVRAVDGSRSPSPGPGIRPCPAGKNDVPLRGERRSSENQEGLGVCRYSLSEPPAGTSRGVHTP